MMNCVVTGAPKLSENGAARSKFLIREFAYSGSSLSAIPAQQFERRSLRDLRPLAGMPGIYLIDNLRGDVRNDLATGDSSRDIDLDWVHAGNMVHNHAHGSGVRR